MTLKYARTFDDAMKELKPRRDWATIFLALAFGLIGGLVIALFTIDEARSQWPTQQEVNQ